MIVKRGDCTIFRESFGEFAVMFLYGLIVSPAIFYVGHLLKDSGGEFEVLFGWALMVFSGMAIGVAPLGFVKRLVSGPGRSFVMRSDGFEIIKGKSKVAVPWVCVHGIRKMDVSLMPGQPLYDIFVDVNPDGIDWGQSEASKEIQVREMEFGQLHGTIYTALHRKLAEHNDSLISAPT